MTVPNRQVRRTRARVLEAAHRLLADEGPDAVTHLRVAEAADVARATVYRHWPDRIDLLVDLLESGASPPVFEPPPGDDARTRIIAALGRAAENFEGELGRSLRLLLARADWDERFAHAKAAITGAGRAVLVGLLEEGRRRGELVLDEEPEVLVDRLLGPIVVRSLLFDAPVDEPYVESLVDSVLGS
jgi:AcrR family transcriptional regulator